MAHLPEPTFQIFLSYMQPDLVVARDAYARLHDAGLSVWMDKMNLFPGMEWQYAIEHALKESSVVLVLLSNRSVTRDGYGQKEILLALEQWMLRAPGHVHIIPVRIDECPAHERLQKLQWIDVFGPEGWEKLVTYLQSMKRNNCQGVGYQS